MVKDNDRKIGATSQKIQHGQKYKVPSIVFTKCPRETNCPRTIG